MKKTIVFSLSLIFCICANAEDKILDCDGTWEEEGMNLPKHAKEFVQKNKDEVTQQYLVRDDSITIVSGTPDIKNDTLQLCSKTNSTYIYSWDCAVKEPRWMAVDWTRENNPLSKDSEFHKKWLPKPESYIGARIIYLDRVSLSVIDDEYHLYISTEDDKKGNATNIQKNYAIIFHSKLQCRIAKPKL